ncbi:MULTISPECIES: hypothetical protein [unclassified Kribbella]|uniref:hypothetical protein n=1 Tax=unclassified Kribbella TaxID=2644121 RepID=UPI00340FC9BD
MSRHHRSMVLLLLAVACLLLTGPSASALAPPGTLEYEPSYYEGETVVLQIPSATTANPNQAHFACFALGPDLSTAKRSAPAPRLYVILAPGATQVACPDGTLRHDHVLSAVPGASGYTGAWTIVLAVPGPAFAVTKMPYTSVAAVEAGVTAAELALVETGILFMAPVVGGR